MHKFDFGYLGSSILAYTFYGLIAGFMIYFAIGFFLDAPMWVFGLSLFFIPFHYEDMKAMGWKGGTERYLWIVVMTTGIFGTVWFFFPKEDWTPPALFVYAVVLIPLSTLIAFVLGLVEGLKPNLVEPRLSQIKEWWLNLGGYL